MNRRRFLKLLAATASFPVATELIAKIDAIPEIYEQESQITVFSGDFKGQPCLGDIWHVTNASDDCVAEFGEKTLVFNGEKWISLSEFQNVNDM